MKRKYAHYLLLLILSVVVMYPYFGKGEADVVAYMKLVDFFKGQAAFEELINPFAYRVLYPLLVAQIPTENSRFVFAVLNLLSIFASSIIIVEFLRNLGYSEEESILGGYLNTVAFPVFYYAATPLTDAGAYLFTVLGLLLLHKRKYWLFFLTLIVGVWVKETVLVNLAAFFLTQPWDKLKKYGALFLIPFAEYLLIRLLFRELPYDYYIWTSSIERVLANLTRIRTHLSFLLTLGPLILLSLFAAGNKLRADDNRFLIRVILAYSLLPLYALSAAYFDGRYPWVLYPAIIPFSVSGFTNLKQIAEKKLVALRSRGKG